MKEFFKGIIAAILAFEARILLVRTRPKIIAITGNVGKTSTKDAIYSVIKQKVYARKSEKSFNSEIGVPLTILGVGNAWGNPILWLRSILEGLIIALFSRKYPEWLVLEMGVDRPGDMKKLTRWIKPDIVVLTRFPDVPVHVEYFDEPEDVIREKLVLLDALEPNGVLVYNHDDEAIRTAAENIFQKKIGYSRYSQSDYTASGDVVIYTDGIPTGLLFSLSHESTSVSVEVVGSLGVQYAYTFGAAIAVGCELGLTMEEGRDALRNHQPTPGRMRLIPGIKDTLILDDSYNASPTATELALETLAGLTVKGRKIAVLGDMLELGRFSVSEHEKIGISAASKVDLLITVGVRARGIAQAALDSGLPESRILQYEDSPFAGKELEGLIKTGDVILAKGSQRIRMEKLVEELMAEPARAQELLVRQDGMWQHM